MLINKWSIYKVRVIRWATDRGIFEKGNPLSQFEKTFEELGELGEALVHQNKGEVEYVNSKGKKVNTEEEIKDAFGDILVTLIIGAKMQNLKLEDCLESAYDVISKRTGTMIDGKFVKDSE